MYNDKLCGITEECSKSSTGHHIICNKYVMKRATSKILDQKGAGIGGNVSDGLYNFVAKQQKTNV